MENPVRGVNGASKDTTLTVEVRYFACDDGDRFCIPVTQSYAVSVQLDPDAGRVTARGGRPGGGRSGGGRGMGGRRGDVLARLMQRDTNGDGKLGRDEFPERMSGRFDDMDSNGDGLVDKAEIEAMMKRVRGQGGRRGDH